MLRTSALMRPRGYVDTTYEEVITSDNVLALVTPAPSRRRSIKSAPSVTRKNESLAAAKARQRLQKHTALVEESEMARRAALCNMSLHEYKQQLRSLEVRRAVARCRTVQLQQHETGDYVPDGIR